MAVTALKPEHHFAKHVSSGRLKRHDDDVVYGCYPQAFEMRENEKEISGSWVEFFAGPWRAQLAQTVQAISCLIKMKPRDGLAVSKVESIQNLCSEVGVKVRILHEPSKANPNPAYSAVRGLPRDNDGLLGLIAAACVEVATIGSLTSAPNSPEQSA